MSKALHTVTDAQRAAKRRLPKSVHVAIMSDVERGITRDNNYLAFDEIGLIPRLADLGDVHEQATEVLGQKLSLPVITSPVAAHGVCAAGEFAVARGTKAVGTAMALSNFATPQIEQIVAENPATFFQPYWHGTKDDMQGRCRARAQGKRQGPYHRPRLGHDLS